MKLTSNPKKVLHQHFRIATGNDSSGSSLMLRRGHVMDKLSYIKKVCFEVNIRLLALYHNVGPEAFRLTKGTMKALLKDLPDVIPWSLSPLPEHCITPLVLHGTDLASCALTAVVSAMCSEARPLLGNSTSTVSERIVEVSRERVSFGTYRWIWCLPETVIMLFCFILLLICVSIGRCSWRLVTCGSRHVCNIFNKFLLAMVREPWRVGLRDEKDLELGR